MKLSYIIPVYKVEKYLRQCIDSVLAQTMDDYEIILVDDGSPDSCPKICDEYREKHPDIIKVIHKENGGVYMARNVAVDVAKGEYLFFIDSDDMLISDNVNELYQIAVKYDADILQTSYILYNEKGNVSKKVRSMYTEGKLLSHKDIEKEICGFSTNGTSMFLWRNIYKKQFLIDKSITFDETLRSMADGPFNIRAFLSAERVFVVDIPIYEYRIREDSLQRQKYVKNFCESYQRHWDLKMKYYSECSDNAPEFYKDSGEYTLKVILPRLLKNEYVNNPNSFDKLKEISNCEAVRKSFEDYDINEFKSKSLDWTMTNFIKKKMYFPAHLICKYVLYK